MNLPPTASTHHPAMRVEDMDPPVSDKPSDHWSPSRHLTTASGGPELELLSHTSDFLTQRNYEGDSMMITVLSLSGLDDLLCSDRQIIHPLIVHTLPLYFGNPINSTVWAIGTRQ